MKKVEGPLHFIGIKGSGMAPLAEIAAYQGYQVQGSDASSQAKPFKNPNIRVFSDHQASHLGTAKTIVYSSAIPKENIERKTAEQLSLACLHRSELLAELMSTKRAITIAGTHGKTTTTAMIAYVLYQLGIGPTAAVGGVMKNFDSSCLLGDSDWFVAEADESDGTFCRYRPFIGVVNNIDADHLDHFGNIAELEQAFFQHMQKLDPQGRAVLGWDHPRVRDLGHRLDGQRLGFGFVLGSDVRALAFECKNGRSHIDAIVEKTRVQIDLPMMGRHNAANALASLSVCRALELNIKQAAESLSTFGGVKRRGDILREDKQIILIDDYAHNPQKISDCLRSIRESWPECPIIALFQPHRYSRTRSLYDGFCKAFCDADTVLLTPIYGAGETEERWDLKAFATDISIHSQRPCEIIYDQSSALEKVKRALSSRSVIISLGAGDIRQTCEYLKEQL